jgi:hypothetical protein
MSWSLSLGFTLDRVLIAAAVVPTVAVISYGGVVAVGAGGDGSLAEQVVTDTRTVNDRQYVLQYADGQKAMFGTDEGTKLVMVGSPLDGAGRVQSIKLNDGHWTVTTNKGVTFVMD